MRVFFIDPRFRARPLLASCHDASGTCGESSEQRRIVRHCRTPASRAYGRSVPGRIQSIERAVGRPAPARGGADRALRSARASPRRSICRGDHPRDRPTLHDVGFVDQEPDDGPVPARRRASLRLDRGLDDNELRAPAMNWADALAAQHRAGGADRRSPTSDAVEIIHHVFRPDGSPQQLRTGQTPAVARHRGGQVPAGLRAHGRAACSAAARWRRWTAPHLHDDGGARRATCAVAREPGAALDGRVRERRGGAAAPIRVGRRVGRRRDRRPRSAPRSCSDRPARAAVTEADELLAATRAPCRAHGLRSPA